MNVQLNEAGVGSPVDQSRPAHRRNGGRAPRLRIVVHDYGGYPFIVQLSRALAARGHQILHLYAEGFRRPKGPMDAHPGDPAFLQTEPVTLSESLLRGGLRRISQERRYGKRLARRITSFGPDVVISANAPLDVQMAAVAAAHDKNAAFAFWLQDLHSVAIRRIVGRHLRILGALIGIRFARLERRLLRESELVVAISPAFLPTLRKWGVAMDSIEVIENWAPLEDDELPGRTNAWAAEHGLLDRPVVLYAGTLALKHNPALLLALARGLPGATVVVVAEGPGADWLQAHSRAMDNLRLLPLQPYSRLSEVLASADLLVAVLEPDASSFSAPSKVLTYLAAAKAILAAIPQDNAATQTILRAEAGVVVDPTDSSGLVVAARQLLDDPARLRAAGAAGRAFAREAFDIQHIADRFEAVFYRAVDRRRVLGVEAATKRGQATDTPQRRTLQ